MDPLSVLKQSLATSQPEAVEEQVARRLEMQERQRRVHDLLNTLWLQKQQLLWKLESEFQPS
jgi:hypothetical protein